MQRHKVGRFLAAALITIAAILPQTIVPAAAANERALYLYYTHTKETARIVFKRDGKYVQSGLNDLNQFLRDWRRNEPTKMDPALFDLVWEVYQEVGATQPINIVSAYRSPATNNMLRETTSGVAENSQHTKGHAMDFFIPGISLAKLRAAAMKKQVGGVGYYPTSGSPFVHLDTGSVRAWPRMTRAQLKEIFPDGKTMHLPTDGKPLSQQGYQVAMADWKQCHRYPCGGNNSGTSSGGGQTLFGMIFGNGDKAQPASAMAAAPVQVAAATPAPRALANAPVPFLRPAALGAAPTPTQVASADITPAIPFGTAASAPLSPEEMTSGVDAPFPIMKSAAIQQRTSTALPAGDAVTALAALTAPIPQPRLIMTNPPAQDDAEVVTAYLPPMQQDPQAQRALEMLIDRETTAATTRPSTPPSPTQKLPILPTIGGATGLRTASLGGTDGLTGLFNGTFGAATQNQQTAAALADHLSRATGPDAMRSPDLVSPDLEHVTEIFLAPAPMTTDHFAAIWDHDEADFDPTPELGRYVTLMHAGDFPQGLAHNRFVTAAPIALATN